MKAVSWVLLSASVAALIGVRCERGRPHAPDMRGLNRSAPELSIREVCAKAKVAYPPKRVFIRVFKQERELELWGGNARGRMTLLQTYPIAAASGGPGPKRREGDMQVPEGVYRVARFNPNSRFHLSLGLNYPNESDRILGDRPHLGGDTYIHGNHVSAGCMAMTDPKIEEIYGLAWRGKKPVPVHIFPCRMSGDGYAQLRRKYPGLVLFWRQLEPVFQAFDASHDVPRVVVDRGGDYVLRP